MIRWSYIISLFILVAFIASCSQKVGSTLVTLPLYQSCIDVLPRYERKLKRLGYDVDFVEERFSNGSVPAHPGLVGLLRVVGSIDRQELAEVQNGLAVACMPADFIKVKVSNLGLQDMIRTMREAGPAERFLALDGDDLVLYLNNSTDDQRSLVLD